MFSVLWICTPSLLAKAWSRAVFPEEGWRVRRGRPRQPWGKQMLRTRGELHRRLTSRPGLRVTGFLALLFPPTENRTEEPREAGLFWTLRSQQSPS